VGTFTDAKSSNVEEKQVRRVGAVAPHLVDVKLIAATRGEVSSHGATAESPTTCISERYVVRGGNT
jgi:transcriptional regulator with AAA-type ATPase domain